MRTRLKTWLMLALFLGTAVYALAEEITLTTYYPSPRGVYQELKTAGDMVVGDITNPPGARLHVVGSGTAPALRVDDVPGGDTSPFLIDASGNVGIGTASPQNRLDVEGGSVIGATYSGSTTAPSNGLLVEGNVGIGTASPSQRLHVAGNAVVEDGQVQLGNLDNDPAAIGDGTVYYNTTTGTFRGFMAGAWGDIGLGAMWDSGCFPISPGGIYTFTHNLGAVPRLITVYGATSAACSSAGILRHMDNNSLGSGGYALYPLTATQVTLRISGYFGNDICSHDHPGCSDTAATHARIILMR